MLLAMQLWLLTVALELALGGRGVSPNRAISIGPSSPRDGVRIAAPDAQTTEMIAEEVSR